MPFGLPKPRGLHCLTFDGWLLFATRCIRMFAYGFLSVVLVLYLKELGLAEDHLAAVHDRVPGHLRRRPASLLAPLLAKIDFQQVR